MATLCVVAGLRRVSLHGCVACRCRAASCVVTAASYVMRLHRVSLLGYVVCHVAASRVVAWLRRVSLQGCVVCRRMVASYVVAGLCHVLWQGCVVCHAAASRVVAGLRRVS